MASDHLEIPSVSASQNSKTLTINEADNLLDRALNGGLTLDIDNADHTLTDIQPTDAEAKQNFFIDVTTTTTLTADRTVFVPADRKWWIFRQSGNVNEQFTVLVQVTGPTGSAIPIPNGGTILIYCTGSDCIEMLRLDSPDSSALAGTTGAVSCDFDGDLFRTATLTGAMTLSLFNPRQGKTLILDITGGGFALTLPVAVSVLSGSFQPGARNIISILCNNESTPTYLATIQQV